jgi:predicted cupin superfamily sugar epimerase
MNPRPELSAAEVIRLLELAPHPEGGHYRETFRDAEGATGRAASTAIYFLLQAGEVSRWHRVDAAEVWHSHVCGQARTQPLVRSQSTGPWGQVQIGRQGEELSAKRQSINLSFAG